MEIAKKEAKPFIIIICVIIGLFLVGFCIWYGVNYFKGEEKPNNPVDNPPVVNPEQKNDEILNFPQEGGESALLDDLLELLPEGKINENFKNLTYTKDGNTYKYDCESYESKCNLVKVTINNETSINTVDYNDRTGELKLYKVGNYYIAITEHDYIATLKIYSENTEALSAKATSRAFMGNDLLSTKPIIVNNKLYYVEYNGERLSDGTFNCRYGYIDLLNGINFVSIQSLKLKIDDYEDK